MLYHPQSSATTLLSIPYHLGALLSLLPLLSGRARTSSEQCHVPELGEREKALRKTENGGYPPHPPPSSTRHCPELLCADHRNDVLMGECRGEALWGRNGRCPLIASLHPTLCCWHLLLALFYSYLSSMMSPESGTMAHVRFVYIFLLICFYTSERENGVYV